MWILDWEIVVLFVWERLEFFKGGIYIGLGIGMGFWSFFEKGKGKNKIVELICNIILFISLVVFFYLVLDY